MLDSESASTAWQQRQALGAAKGILLDWDGCIAINNRVLPLARKLIGKHFERIAIVSNNSTHLPCDLERLLAVQGVHFPKERIFLAGAEAIREVAARDSARVLLLSVQRMRTYAQALGIKLVEQNADLVLLMRDANFTYRKLTLAANALHSGAGLVIANDDATHPGPNNSIVPETGALLAALQVCSGTGTWPCKLVGKPATLLFERACARLGVAAEEAVMIGDNPYTDGEGAIRAGIRAIIIGGTSPVRLEHLVEPDWS